ncbi:MAG: methylated-DNA--[protein]-cysteine S-methyltransferase [Beijerinckiaceae bacterium]
MKSTFHLYETSLGCCALIWRNARVIGAQLPMADRAATARRVLQRFPDAMEVPPPDWIMSLADDVKRLLAEGGQDLSAAPLALETVPAFDRAVYEIVRGIPPGRTLTYGEIARTLGGVEDARRVGQAMGANPFPPLIPCHRVVTANGKPGGFSAFGGIETKIKLLSIEQARLGGDSGLFGALPLAIKPR